MDVVLVDTSVRVNFFKGRETSSSLFLRNNLSNIIVATCPVILQEVLQGIVTDSEFNKIKVQFDALTKLTGNPYALANDAAQLYRELRAKGVTVRKPNDCLIAIYAIRSNIALLHEDKDFKMIANHATLKTIDLE